MNNINDLLLVAFGILVGIIVWLLSARRDQDRDVQLLSRLLGVTTHMLGGKLAIDKSLVDSLKSHIEGIGLGVGGHTDDHDHDVWILCTNPDTQGMGPQDAIFINLDRMNRFNRLAHQRHLIATPSAKHETERDVHTLERWLEKNDPEKFGDNSPNTIDKP